MNSDWETLRVSVIKKMNWKQCPICDGNLEVIDVSPCYDCGHIENEIKHFRDGKHKYNVYSIFGLEITLCDVCYLEFEQYGPEYFGLTKDNKFSHKQISFVRDSEKQIEKDKFCIECGHRLSFLKFLFEVRNANNNNS